MGPYQAPAGGMGVPEGGPLWVAIIFVAALAVITGLSIAFSGSVQF